jgi:hypothetical protein
MAGLLESILTAPILPLRGVVSLARVVQREAERERHESGVRRLEELDEASRAGEISPAEHDQAQQDVLNAMMGGPDPAQPGERR